MGFIKGVYFDLAHCYEAAGKLNQAIDAYQSSLLIDPGDTVILNNLAVVNLRTDHIETAKESLKGILELNPRDVMAMTNLALCYIRQNNFQEAEALLRQALTINSQFAPARQNLEKLLQPR